MVKLKEKINQLFIFGYRGQDFKEDKDFFYIFKKNLGGIIFFTENIVDKKQFKAQIEEIKKLAFKTPMFLSIDEEGGRVERFENLNKNCKNGKKYLSARYIAQKGERALKKQTENICKDLKYFSLNMNFAPVLDVDSNPQNPIIGERAYSNDPKSVAKYALLSNEIYNENGIITVGKHFPGHGDTYKDSHIEMPEVDMDFETFEKTHLYPFKKAVEQGIPALMISHVHYKCFDEEKIPASVSKNVLDYLTKTLKYRGLIVSDDMSMGAVKGLSQYDTVVTMLKNGVNCFIYRYCNSDILEMLKKIEQAAKTDETLRMAIETSFSKIMRLKRKFLVNFRKQTKMEKFKLNLLTNTVYAGFKFQIPLTKFTFVNKPDTKKPFIIAAWHSNQCAIYGMKDVINRVNILISPSNDGKIVGDACKKLGFKVIKGSRGKEGAVQGMFQLLDALKSGDIAAIMIDGPKGPKHIVQPGIIELAKLSGMPIIPMTWYSPNKNFLKFNSWDEFRVPIGYCRVVNLYGEPIYVNSDVSNEEFEQKRLELEEQLKLLHEKAVNNYSEYIKNAK